jgi:uncharacterized protein (TIGR03067 family)
MRTTLLVAALSLVGAAADDKKGAKALEKFEGSWELVSGEIDGKPIADEHVKKGKIKTARSEATLQVPHHSPKTVKGTLKRADDTKKPMELDFLRVEGPNKEVLMLAIVEFDGDDKYKICFDPAGKERPTSFATKAGSGHILHVWKRAKE